jgi:glutamate carboxypeptidase
LQQCVEQAGETLGQTVRWKDSGGASDGNKLQALGIPNIDTFGPRGDGLHSYNEWIELDSLPEKALLTFETLRTLYYR